MNRLVLSQSKIRDLIVSLMQKNVRGLHIPVDNVVLTEVLESREDLLKHFQDFLLFLMVLLLDVRVLEHVS